MKKCELSNVYFRYPKKYQDYENIKLNPKHLKHAIDVSFTKLKVYAVKCKEQYIDEFNDDKENSSNPFTLEKYNEWIQELRYDPYNRNKEYNKCWWEDVFSNNHLIKKMLHAIAANPAWWLSFLETRLKQEYKSDDSFNKKQNQKKICA